MNEYITSAGENPHYIQTGNSYTDASYVASALGTSTYTENMSFTPELNINVADTYTQTYTVSNSDYVDVARTLTRDISVDDLLDLSGESPHYIQTGNSYTDEGVKEPTGIANGSTSSTLVQKNAPVYADGFNYDGSGIEVPYDASHNEDSFSVSMWVDASSTASYQPLMNSLTSSVVSSTWATNPIARLRASDAGGDDEGNRGEGYSHQ